MGLLTLAASALLSGNLSYSPCLVEGFSQPAQCAAVNLPENSVQVIKIAAIAPSNKAPVVLLVGGPGQAASEQSLFASRALGELHYTRDILLIDQPGTGTNAAVDCTWPINFTTCARSAAQRPDLSTTGYVDQLIQVLNQADIDQVVLWGGSYGTYVAQLFAQLHSERVESMVLDGVVGLDQSPFVMGGLYVDQALQGVGDICIERGTCIQPLAQQVTTLLTELERRDTDLADKVRHLIRAALYSPVMASRLPAMVEQANRGNFAAFDNFEQQVQHASFAQMYVGQTLAIACREFMQIPPSTLAELRASDGLIGDRYYQYWYEQCSLANIEASPSMGPWQTLNIPTLLISGALDPITPKQGAQAANKWLSNANHIDVAEGSHLNSHKGCLPKLIGRFVESQIAPDASCTNRIKLPLFAEVSQ